MGAARRAALLVACCYPGTAQALRGPAADAEAMHALLTQRLGFAAGEVTVMRDDVPGAAVPTKGALLDALGRLVAGAAAGDALFFHFSGHGVQRADLDGDERDGFDEALVAADLEPVLDDALNAVLVRGLPPGCVLHAVVDACHSGTALDLRFRTRWDRAQARHAWVDEARASAAATPGWTKPGPAQRLWAGVRKGARKVQAPLFSARNQADARKGSGGGLVLQLGAARDSQLAADGVAGARLGAATFAFVSAVERALAGEAPGTYGALLDDMRASLAQGRLLQRLGLGGLDWDPDVNLGPWAQLVVEVAGGRRARFALHAARLLSGQRPVLCSTHDLDLYATRALFLPSAGGGGAGRAERCDVAVVGAGVCGLFLARELLRARPGAHRP